jgi:hypothetical protein
MLRSDLPISLPYHSAVDYNDLLGIDMDQGAADMGSFIVPFKCKVLLAGLTITETNAGATIKDPQPEVIQQEVTAILPSLNF